LSCEKVALALPQDAIKDAQSGDVDSLTDAAQNPQGEKSRKP
jgi:hypothetical protein